MTDQTNSRACAVQCRRPPSCKPSAATLEDVADYENLLMAFKAVSKGRCSRVRIFLYQRSLGSNLERLRQRLLDGSYRVKPPHVFEIFCISGRKKRVISSMRLEDAIVQHAIYQVVYCDFDRGFIYDSYGCRKNKGSHRASDRTMEFIRKSPPDSWYLQLDVSKYYYSIRHDKLRESIERRIKDPRLVELMMAQTAQGTDVGLCVGGMISQMYGAIYLDRLDHYAKRVLHIKHYIRYVDDILIVGLSREECRQLRDHLQEYLQRELGLRLSKAKIARLTAGINFVGFRHWRNYRLVRKLSLRNFGRALRAKRYASVQAIMAHAYRTRTLQHYLQRIRTEWTADDIRHLAKPFQKLITESITNEEH